MGGTVIAFGPFDDLRSGHLRFLEEASKLGELVVLVWPDETIARVKGAPARLTMAERLYFLQGLRYVRRAIPVEGLLDPGSPPVIPGLSPGIWADLETEASEQRRSWCQQANVAYHVISESLTKQFPESMPLPAPSGRKKVIATGCYDWLHSGHVRFFEEASTYGDLFVVVGSDANIRLLKGTGHPLLPQAERRYLVASIRHVTGALISTGQGWLDAEPEIRQLKPDIYAVNEDGDRGGKREFCAQNGIQYLVLKRLPAPGLPPRSSTALRGF